jgi:hypothetical protein
MVEEAERAMWCRKDHPDGIQRSVEPTASDMEVVPIPGYACSLAPLHGETKGAVAAEGRVITFTCKDLEKVREADLVDLLYQDFLSIALAGGGSEDVVEDVVAPVGTLLQFGATDLARPQEGVGPALTNGPEVDTVNRGLNSEATLTMRNLSLDQGTFDLNRAPVGDDGCSSGEFQVSLGQDRAILGAADDRLNKEARGAVAPRVHARGIARLAVPFKKALVNAPVERSKTIQSKKPAHAEKPIRGVPGNLSIDEKATMVLIRAADANAKVNLLSDDLKQNFYGQFAEATQEGLVRNMRTVFGLSADGVGSLAVLADEASE